MTVDEIERDFYLKNTPLPEYIVEMAEIGENSPRSVGDISAGFPEEDFLDDVLSDLDCIIEQMHGNNKSLPALKDLVLKLRDVAKNTRNNAEYGESELSKLCGLLGV